MSLPRCLPIEWPVARQEREDRQREERGRENLDAGILPADLEQVRHAVQRRGN